MVEFYVSESIEIIANSCDMFREKLVADLEVDVEKCADYIEGSLAMCTSLAPVIGYDAAAGIAKEAYATGRTVREVAREKKVLSEDELNKLLDPLSMTEPQH